MPVLFLLVKSSTGARIRELMNMTDPSSNFYFNPDSKGKICNIQITSCDRYPHDCQISQHRQF